MKLSHLWGVLGVAVLVAVLIAHAKNSGTRDDLDRRIEACQQVGRVADDCSRLVPSIEVCHVEDCSDVKGSWGFFNDHGVWYLRRVPETVIRPQRPGS